MSYTDPYACPDCGGTDYRHCECLQPNDQSKTMGEAFGRLYELVGLTREEVLQRKESKGERDNQ